MIKPAFVLSAAILLASCSPPAEPAPQEAAKAPEAAPPAPVATAEAAPPVLDEEPEPATDDWRAAVQPGDAERLGNVPAEFARAVERARGDGHAEEIDKLGALLKTGGALDRSFPSPGAYRCRSIQMAANGLTFIAYPFFRCEVELTPGGDLIARKLTGSQRFQGKLYPDGDKRLAFLGGAAWGMDEKGYPPYGQSFERDQVGTFERIGENRYRLTVLGGFPNNVEVIELIR